MAGEAHCSARSLHSANHEGGVGTRRAFRPFEWQTPDSSKPRPSMTRISPPPSLIASSSQPPHFRHLFVSSSRRLSISVQSHEKTSRRRYNDSLIGVTAFLHLEPGAYSDTCSCNSAKVGVTLRGSACSRLCHCSFTALVIAFDAIILRRLLRGRKHVSIASSKGSTNIPPEMKQVSGHPLRQGDARFSAPRPGRCPPPGRARRSVSQQLAPEVDQYGMAR